MARTDRCMALGGVKWETELTPDEISRSCWLNHPECRSVHCRKNQCLSVNRLRRQISIGFWAKVLQPLRRWRYSRSPQPWSLVHFETLRWGFGYLRVYYWGGLNFCRTCLPPWRWCMASHRWSLSFCQQHFACGLLFISCVDSLNGHSIKHCRLIMTDRRTNSYRATPLRNLQSQLSRCCQQTANSKQQPTTQIRKPLRFSTTKIRLEVSAVGSARVAASAVNRRVCVRFELGPAALNDKRDSAVFLISTTRVLVTRSWSARRWGASIQRYPRPNSQQKALNNVSKQCSLGLSSWPDSEISWIRQTCIPSV